MKIRLNEVRQQIRSILREQSGDLNSMLVNVFTTKSRDAWLVFLDALEEQMPDVRAKLGPDGMVNIATLAQEKFPCLEVPQSNFDEYASICVDIVPLKVRAHFGGWERFNGIELYEEQPQPFAFFFAGGKHSNAMGFLNIVAFHPPVSMEMQNEVAEYDVEWMAEGGTDPAKMSLGLFNAPRPLSVFEEDSPDDFRMLRAKWSDFKKRARTVWVELSNLLEVEDGSPPDDPRRPIPVPNAKKSE